jgi:hypothetical protein
VGNWPSVGQATQRLCKTLERALAGRLERLWIVIAGWQLYRRGKRPRAFGLAIEKLRDHSAPTLLKLPRHSGRQCSLITAPEGHLSSEEQRALINKIGFTQADESERAMVAEMRKVTDRTNVVGRHCMCVMLPPPEIGWARIRYDSPTVEMGYLVSKRETLPFPAAFTPWILAEHLTMAPSIMSGGKFETQIGPWLLQIEGTRREQGHLQALQFSQQRPPQPK